MGKFYDWGQRYGNTNQHNGRVPRDFWLQDAEKQAILDFQELYPLEGYRRLSYMMIDCDVVAVSPSSVFRVLREAGRLRRWAQRSSKKGTGFEQPLAPHEHWHIDIAHINIHGTFYYLCAVLDGASRYLVAWSLRPSMTEAEVEILLQRAKEKFPEARPRIISDNGPQFIAKDFKEFIRISGMTHVAPRRITRSRTEKWNGGISRSKVRASAPVCPCQWRTPSTSSRSTSRSTMNSACIAQSDMSLRRRCWTDARRKSVPRGIRSWSWLDSAAREQPRLRTLNQNLPQGVRLHSR